MTRYLLLFAIIALPNLAVASEFLTIEPNNTSYNFVTHYRIDIEAPASKVWPYLVDLKSWTYEFELSPIQGEGTNPGDVLRLYEGQDFRLQITSAIPHKALTIANLPITFKGEFGTGIGVFTLHEFNGRTEVALTMSRRYSVDTPEHAALRETRDSKKFQDQTRAMWKDRFLKRLKDLSESKTTKRATE